VVVVVDALRGDTVEEETTPFMASLSGSTAAIAPGTWTFPSVSSMLTGVYPHEHGALHGPSSGDDERMVLPPRMAEDRTTLSEVLAGAGYETYGGFGHDTPFVALSGRFGTHSLHHQINARADDVLSAHLDWLGDHADERTFSFVHLADPHIPVDPPAKYWEAHDIDGDIPDLRNWAYQRDFDPGEAGERYREHRRRLYRASVDYVDDALKRYRERLDNLVSDRILVVTSDHGESMWENVATDLEYFGGSGCVGHGGTPYEALTRVPLLVDGDDQMSAPQDDVSLIDLVPTMLEAVGIEDSLSTAGVSFGERTGDCDPILVEGNLGERETKAAYRAQFKIIVSNDGTTVGFDLPDETPTGLPDDVEAMLVDAVPSSKEREGEGTDVAGVVEDRLEQLGYK
jgi:arylsulfatase A-like enzyme